MPKLRQDIWSGDNEESATYWNRLLMNPIVEEATPSKRGDGCRCVKCVVQRGLSDSVIGILNTEFLGIYRYRSSYWRISSAELTPGRCKT